MGNRTLISSLRQTTPVSAEDEPTEDPRVNLLLESPRVLNQRLNEAYEAPSLFDAG
jgi:hypothetical protein